MTFEWGGYDILNLAFELGFICSVCGSSVEDIAIDPEELKIEKTDIVGRLIAKFSLAA